MPKNLKPLSLLLLNIFLCICSLYSQNNKTSVSYWPTENWIVTTPEEQGVDSEKLLKMLEFIQSSLTLDFHSILVIRNGCIITETYWAPYNKNTTHNIKSASKSILSTLAGIALEKNYLDNLEQKVSEFYPEYVNEPLKQDISLEDLLTMTGGFNWMEDAGPSPYDLENWNKIAMRDKPGEEFEYNTMMTHMMSAILTKVCGISTKDFADKWLFKPLGIKNYQWRKGADGIYYGGSDIFLTPRDMAKFGFLFLNNGMWDEKRILPKEWIKKSTSRIVDIPNEISYAVGLDYGYWWWIQEKAYMAWGAGGQYIIVNPNLDLIVVFTADGFDDINLYEQFMKQFLEDYIYSSVISETSIPAKPTALKKINDIIQELENPKEIPIEQTPKIAATISTNNYIFDKNDAGFQSTSFIFSDSKCVWEYYVGEQRVNLQVGLNVNYLINEIAFSMGVNPNGEKIACKGYWNSNVFIIEHHIIGDPSKQIFKFNFDENIISMNLTTIGMDVVIKGTKKSKSDNNDSSQSFYK